MKNIEFTHSGTTYKFPVFEGRTIDQMSTLLQRVPNISKENYNRLTNLFGILGYKVELPSPLKGASSMAFNMDLRNLASKLKDNDLINQVYRNYLDSGDGIVYNTDGRIKIFLDSLNLKKLNPLDKNNLAWSGALNLEKKDGVIRFDELPDEANGIQLVFTRDEINKYIQMNNTPDTVCENKILLALARGNEERLETHAENVAQLTRRSNVMNLHISVSPEFQAERFWCLYNLNNISNVSGNYNGRLDFNDGRLVGVAPEVQYFAELDKKRKINLEGLM